MAINTGNTDYQQDLGDGLVMRWSTAEDTEKIAYLVAKVFRDSEDEPLNDWGLQEIRTYMSGLLLPMIGVNDFGVVEDTSKPDRPLVAAMCLQRQYWEYEGIPFTVGRPEDVVSDVEYRNRGLIRALFGMLHARCEAEGHMVQGITGIPHYYLQFGYDYALEWSGSRIIHLTDIPALKEGEQEAYTLREATAADLPVVQTLYEQHRSRFAINSQIPDEFWYFHVEGWRNGPGQSRYGLLMLIEDAQHTLVGMFVMSARRWSNILPVYMLIMARGANLQAVVPSLMRELKRMGETIPVAETCKRAFEMLNFELGSQHPIYPMLNSMFPYIAEARAWYIRVPDVPRFLQHITPALERRLADSELAGYSGEMKINFYRHGVRIVFEQGRITTVEPWKEPPYGHDYTTGIPYGVFLKALFGYRSLDELKSAHADVRISDDGLFKVLFPKKAAYIVPLP